MYVISFFTLRDVSRMGEMNKIILEIFADVQFLGLRRDREANRRMEVAENVWGGLERMKAVRRSLQATSVGSHESRVVRLFRVCEHRIDPTTGPNQAC